MWQETNNPEQPLSAKLTDVVFKIDCRRLPIDHAAALANAVCDRAPMVADTAGAGVHSVHVAGSQNGWERPDEIDGHLLLSKRTRLRIRIDNEHAAALIDLLNNSTMDVDGSPLHILAGHARALIPAATLFCRHSFFEDLDKNPDESLFIERLIDHCKSMNFSPTKILCGREHVINTNNGPRLTRSVLLADVAPRHSLNLQDNGLGDARTMGCGLLIPHKDTGSITDDGATTMQ